MHILHGFTIQYIHAWCFELSGLKELLKEIFVRKEKCKSCKAIVSFFTFCLFYYVMEGNSRT